MRGAVGLAIASVLTLGLWAWLVYALSTVV
jgi:hypothetical protein